jgi:hypothetical protein
MYYKYLPPDEKMYFIAMERRYALRPNPNLYQGLQSFKNRSKKNHQLVCLFICQMRKTYAFYVLRWSV